MSIIYCIFAKFFQTNNFMASMYKYIVFIGLLFFLSCSTKQEKATKHSMKEDLAKKALLQGTWMDNHTEVPILQIKGDSMYYMDAMPFPVAFKVIGDSLFTYGAQVVSYYIDKLDQYSLELQTEIGDVIQMGRFDESMDSFLFTSEPESSEPSREVIQKDHVSYYNNVRYRGYVYINPSQIKVVRPEYSEEGFKVDHVYYDNVIHICVYEGKKKLFGKDIFKKDFTGIVPDDFLQWAILSDMDFMGVNEKGYQYQATVCIPNVASCYLVNLSIATDGNISYELEQ